MSKVNFAVVNASVTAEEGARLACELSRGLIELGDYEQACEALSGVWAGVGREPELRGLSDETAAEVLLAAGVAAGFAGKARREAGAQEFAKDLIGRALRSFAELGLGAREADAQICLAVCYWREGGFDDARLLLRVVLGSLGEGERELRLRALLWLAAVEKMSARYNEALQVYEQAAPLAEESGDNFRRGNFHSDRGQVLLHLGEKSHDEALLARAAEDFGAAHELYTRAGHLRYAGYVQNNLGYLMNVMGRSGDAHASLDRAREIFAGLSDANSLAQVDDTRARVLVNEKRHDEAVESSARAVGALEGGDEYGLLVEALTTHGTALSRAGRFAESLAAFARAEQVADERVGGGAGGRVALVMVEELAAGVCVRAGVGFDAAVHRFEERIIRHALSAAGGRVTEAAVRLGLKYQTLAWMLNTRHAQLLPERTEVRKRRRSIIKKPGKVLKYEKKE